MESCTVAAVAPAGMRITAFSDAFESTRGSVKIKPAAMMAATATNIASHILLLPGFFLEAWPSFPGEDGVFRFGVEEEDESAG